MSCQVYRLHVAKYYSAQDKLKALAVVVAVGGNYHAAARRTGINRQTLRSWRIQADEAKFRTDASGVTGFDQSKSKGLPTPTPGIPRPVQDLITLKGGVARPTTEWQDIAMHVNEAAAGMAARVYEEAASALLDRIPDMSGRDLMIAYGIASDKMLDHRDGRKGMQVKVEVDNRQMVATPANLDQLSLPELRALLDQAKKDEASVESTFA